MHETTKVFNTHGVVVQRMIDKVALRMVDIESGSLEGGGGVIKGFGTNWSFSVNTDGDAD